MLTEAELADLLRLSPVVIGRLLAETDLPRFKVAGQVRFLRDQVLAWFGEQRAPLLATPVPLPPDRARQVSADLRPADESEGPFVTTEALTGLGADAPRGEDNLLRLQARDGLIALADALLPAISRHSNGRLQPAGEDPDRAGLWRAEDAGGTPISSMVFVFSEGAAAAKGDPEGLPRLELTLERTAVSVALIAPAGAGSASAESLEAARTDGAEIAAPTQAGPLVVRFRHPMASRPPTLSAVISRLDADIRHLVPLWLAAAGARA